MSEILESLRSIIREELARQRAPELGIVTQVFSRDSGGSDNNHQVNVRLRSSGVELQHVPVVVGRLGLSMLPAEGDLVVVAFLDGDLNAPVVLGSVYDADRRPPIGKGVEVVCQPPDQGDSSMRRFHFELPSGSTLTIDDDKLHIASGSTEVTVERDGDVTVKSAAKVNIEASGDITLKASGNLELSAQSNVKISGLQVSVEGQSQTQVKGAQITLAGLTNFSAS